MEKAEQLLQVRSMLRLHPAAAPGPRNRRLDVLIAHARLPRSLEAQREQRRRLPAEELGDCLIAERGNIVTVDRADEVSDAHVAAPVRRAVWGARTPAQASGSRVCQRHTGRR